MMREDESRKKNKSSSDLYEYSYCKVCRINHNQGRRHNYFPSHVSSLSSFLSRFLSKLQPLRSSLLNPFSQQQQQHSHHLIPHRLWCVFCDLDILDTGTTFACGNAINHLASADHLKNLKSFMWKFGGKMDQVDSFRISEGDLAKWEKKCKSLNSAAASEGSGRSLIGLSNDIHYELNSECVDIHEKNINHIVSSSFSNCVMPLQYHTNERYQVSNSELVGSSYNGATSDLSAEICFTGNSWGSNNSSGRMDNNQSLVSNDNKWAGNGFSNGGAHADTRMVDGGSCLQGLHNLTQISSVIQENEGNVHTGAPPPWFDSFEKDLLDAGHKFESGPKNAASSYQKSGKIQKLNPKRVGAAWAEKRKIELEMEKRGEIVANNFDDKWLPNFGSVWQSGTRKESKKEFDAENKHSSKIVPQSETLLEIQPYISKRKRKNTDNEA